MVEFPIKLISISQLTIKQKYKVKIWSKKLLSKLNLTEKSEKEDTQHFWIEENILVSIKHSINIGKDSYII